VHWAVKHSIRSNLIGNAAATTCNATAQNGIRGSSSLVQSTTMKRPTISRLPFGARLLLYNSYSGMQVEEIVLNVIRSICRPNLYETINAKNERMGIQKLLYFFPKLQQSSNMGRFSSSRSAQWKQQSFHR